MLTRHRPAINRSPASTARLCAMKRCLDGALRAEADDYGDLLEVICTRLTEEELRRFSEIERSMDAGVGMSNQDEIDSAEVIIRAFGLSDPEPLDPTDPLFGDRHLVDPMRAISIVRISADSPDRLRRCDVYRVMDVARVSFCIEEFRGFARWLRKSVGEDAKREIEEVFLEMTGLESVQEGGRS